MDYQKNEVDASPLLAFLRPFGDFQEWKVAELNAKLRLFQVDPKSREKEEEIIAKLDSIDDISKLDPQNVT